MKMENKHQKNFFLTKNFHVWENMVLESSHCKWESEQKLQSLFLRLRNQKMNGFGILLTLSPTMLTVIALHHCICDTSSHTLQKKCQSWCFFFPFLHIFCLCGIFHFHFNRWALILRFPLVHLVTHTAQKHFFLFSQRMQVQWQRIHHMRWSGQMIMVMFVFRKLISQMSWAISSRNQIALMFIFSLGSTILCLKNIGLHLIIIFIYILCYLEWMLPTSGNLHCSTDCSSRMMIW